MQSTDSFLFRPARDFFVSAIFLLMIGILLAVIPLLAMDGAQGLLVRLVAAMGAAFAALRLVNLLYFTWYEIHPTALVIHTAVTRMEIPYRRITKVAQAAGWRALFSTPGRKRFATSMRTGIVLTLADSDYRSVSLSPLDRRAFLQVLLERIEADRSSRATKIRKRSKR